jgi:uncharacterized protein with HEPN domain
MAGLRDKLIHGYFGINLEVIWKTIRERLPQAKSLIEKVLADVNEKLSTSKPPN